MKKFAYLLMTLTLTLLAGCVTVHHTRAYTLPAHSAMGIAPLVNHTETPLAGRRATEVLVGVLHSRGLKHTVVYKTMGQKKLKLKLTRQQIPHRQLIAWAQKRHLSAVLTGSVTEWRYKVGLDGQPAVGIKLTLLSVPNGKVLWSSVGSKVGHSRQALSAVAQQLIHKMLNGLSITS